MRHARQKQNQRKVLTLRTIVIALIVVLVGGYGLYRLSSKSSTSGPDQRVSLAECLTQKGVKMYGAYWCPHCAQQKKDFGAKAFDKVDYVECAIPGNRLDQTQACKDHNISGYPTWIFPDGSRVSGEQQLSDLAQKAGCSYGDVTPTSDQGTPSDQGAMPDQGATAPADNGSAGAAGATMPSDGTSSSDTGSATQNDGNAADSGSVMLQGSGTSAQ